MASTLALALLIHAPVLAQDTQDETAASEDTSVNRTDETGSDPAPEGGAEEDTAEAVATGDIEVSAEEEFEPGEEVSEDYAIPLPSDI